MVRTLFKIAFLALILIQVDTLPASAGWSWHVGNFTKFSARSTSSLISERTQQAVDRGLDWIVISGESTEGYYPGLRAISREHDLNFPRLTPILATGWRAPDALAESLTILGVDPRAPIPRELSTILDWVSTQSGVVVSTSLYPSSEESRVPHGGIFSGINNGEWHPSTEIGSEWDQMLTEGHQVLISGGNDIGNYSQKVYVWAEDNRTQSIIKAIRMGTSYVADGDGLQMDFRVNGKSMGSSVSLEKDAYIKMWVASKSRITRVILVSDGEVIWDDSPQTQVWEERFFLPLSNRHYIRPIVECEEAGIQAIGNPVFFYVDSAVDMGVLPLEASDRLLPDPMYPEVDGALEVVATLGRDAQRRVLAELLRDESLRHDVVSVLEVREDLVPDHVLRALTDDPDPEVRLGSTYALVVRNPPELPDILHGMLKDGDSRMREYGARSISQFVGGLDVSQLESEIWTSDPMVKSYLIRSLKPDLFDASLTGKLITTIRSPHKSVAAAGVDKLVDMGTQSYRVIKTLLDSSRAGNSQALEPVGLIGDRRSINALEEIHNSRSHGPLKRASFLVLSRMGAPYPDRKSAHCHYVSVPMVVDGIVDSLEWSQSKRIGPFSQDHDASPLNNEISGSLLRDDTHLFLLAEIQDRPGRKPNIHVRHQ
jgi:hypothetical protein